MKTVFKSIKSASCKSGRKNGINNPLFYLLQIKCIKMVYLIKI